MMHGARTRRCNQAAGEKAGRRLGYMGRISNVLMGALGNTVSATK